MKKRLDELVVEKNIAKNIDEARAFIMSGKILVENVCEDKIGTKIDENKNIRLRVSKKTDFVSRGGLKLEKALDTYNINITEKKCMDIGCSTGGFTDLLLRRGARKVYAVDVGVGVLDWKLRNDNRVVVMEKTNIRNIEILGDVREFDFICVDVSFISLKLIIDNICKLLRNGGEVVLLIKPQFEAKKDEVDEGGIVKSDEVRDFVVNDINKFCIDKGLKNIGITKSPITGAKGNIEFLAYYKYE